ncbi:uncharacterized protein LOC109719043 isoform X2 [Ananas comosus]|uniref:Uncharacterized protein LOC109719043 isoform X2 n=2 Tax=Ananas comosus TaxID=4615 RepID=A0A6P5FZX1_ANACO|nr:uncharacterized protein LOC109719043 isoform X2 [Ananas comosus]CAD1818063.1 unnamed protein product [Ananas comosus var. bracteatus]
MQTVVMRGAQLLESFGFMGKVGLLFVGNVSPAFLCTGGDDGTFSSEWRLGKGCLRRRRSNLRCRAGEARNERRGGVGGGAGETDEEWMWGPSASPYEILGVDPISCSRAELKAAFRARVKEFHPDVCKDTKNAHLLIRCVIEAYELLYRNMQEVAAERICGDPFENPECEASDLFVNEIQCVGKGCPYSCVRKAPHAFSFTADNGKARAISQGHGDDYLVQLAVGRCPRRCIHYVTPSQRAILEDLLGSVLRVPYDLAEASLLDSLISKAKFENDRYQKPKRKPRASTEYVDWL